MLNGRVNEMPKEEGLVRGRASLGFEETIGREALEKRAQDVICWGNMNRPHGTGICNSNKC
jgi:hypothetical protein